VQVTEPGKKVTRFVYDLDGNLEELIDSDGKSTRFQYDEAGRLVARVYADQTTWRYQYDDADRLSARISARGIETRYQYNRLGQPVKIAYSDGTPPVTISYDAYGRVETITDATGSHGFEYYLNSSIKAMDGPWETDKLTYSYDVLGRPVAVTPEAGLTEARSYDDLGRLVSVTAGSKTFTYAYRGASQLVTSLTRPESRTTYSYDSLNRLAGIAHFKSDGSLIRKFGYSRNARDQVSAETIEPSMGLAGLAAGRTSYHNNELNQVLATENPDRSYTYDADGNLTKGYLPDGTVFEAAYDAENRLNTISYSRNGISCQKKFTYDYRGFLAQVEEFENHVPKAKLRIVRNGLLAFQDRDRDNNIVAQYTWGLGLGGGIAGLLNLHRSGKDYSYLYDGKGNVSAVVDSEAQIVASYQYSTFGRLMAKTGSLEQPFGFSAKRYFAELGLVYYGFRYYSPAMAKWITRDPIGEKGGVNLYVFVLNNPVNWVDPWGLVTLGDIISTIGTIITKELELRGVISVSLSTSITLVTAPAGDMISPAELNVGEDRILQHVYDMAEADKILEEAKKLNNLLDYYCRHTGGCNYSNTCP